MSENPVFRINGISYLDIPTKNASESAEFYRNVFSWKIGGSPSVPSFEDGTGHVIGHWKKELIVAKDSGIVPYIFVESVEATLEKIIENGGECVKTPYPQGDLLIATFRDRSGNLLGIWQAPPQI